MQNDHFFFKLLWQNYIEIVDQMLQKFIVTCVFRHNKEFGKVFLQDFCQIHDHLSFLESQ